MVRLKKNGNGNIDTNISFAQIVQMIVIIVSLIVTYLLTIQDIKTTQRLQAQIIQQHESKILNIEKINHLQDREIREIDTKVEVILSKEKN